MSLIQDQTTAGIKTILAESMESATSSSFEIYHIHLQQDEDGRYVATCPSLPGVVTDGATEDEALDNVKEAILAVHEAKGITKDFMIISQS